jgi:hypothetical protein
MKRGEAPRASIDNLLIIKEKGNSFRLATACINH